MCEKNASLNAIVTRCAFTGTYAVLPLQTLDQRNGGLMNCGQGKPERSCVEPFRLLVWRRCRRLCLNRSAEPWRRFTARNRAGYCRRSCAFWETWIWPKRSMHEAFAAALECGLRQAFQTTRALGSFRRHASRP